jgi:hypothetical protein
VRQEIHRCAPRRLAQPEAQTGERSQVLDYRNAVLKTFVSVGGKRHKGKRQADAPKYQLSLPGEISARGLKTMLETKGKSHACKILRYLVTLR